LAVRRGDTVFAYENRCPHQGTPLDWMPDQFLDRTGRHLICATHGALFTLERGLCIAGPCLGDHLKRVPLETREGTLHALLAGGNPIS
jgi:nitrite reductase/ring-hydroxylating ferredoxin subunit